MFSHKNLPEELLQKAAGIKLVLTDCDGVLTDAGVYFSDAGEAMKRFYIRDGMGVERLRNLAGIETGIITGETSGSVSKRAEKLKITYLYLGIKDKMIVLREILEKTGLKAAEIAYIGDDTNDLDIMKAVGLAASPGDGTVFAHRAADYICEAKGGNGAFRELAELILFAQKLA